VSEWIPFLLLPYPSATLPIFVSLFASVVCGHLAKKTRRNVPLAFGLGFLFPVVSFFYYLISHYVSEWDALTKLAHRHPELRSRELAKLHKTNRKSELASAAFPSPSRAGLHVRRLLGPVKNPIDRAATRANRRRWMFQAWSRTTGYVRRFALGGFAPAAPASPIRTPAEALAEARRIQRNTGGEVALLLGVPEVVPTFELADLPPYYAALTKGSRIVLTQSWATSTSDADLRGAVLHELVHVFESTPNYSGAVALWSEALADAVRYLLNRPDPEWHESRATRRLLSLSPADFRTFARDLADGNLNNAILRTTRLKL
jgi:hypothetical protein